MKKLLGVVSLISIASGLTYIVIKVIEIKKALKEIGEAVAQTDFSGMSL